MLGRARPPPAWAVSDPCTSSRPEHCYGELTQHGFRRLLHHLPPSCQLQTDSVFYDIGSGFGRLAAYVRAHTNVSRVVGVEINGCRARAAQKRFFGRRPSHSKGFVLLNADIRATGFDDATHLYLTSQCWRPSLLTAIFGRLASRAPRLRCILNVGSLDALAAQDIAALAAPFGPVRWLCREVSGTWDAYAAALVVTRGGCNASCVRRARERIAQASADVEAIDRPGPPNPWRRPAKHAALESLSL